MAKSYYPSDELPHLWAHQSIADGKSSSAMSFSGELFYSYGTVIAAIATGPGGRAYLLAEPSSYSMTTSKHQNKVADAIPHGSRVFTVPAASATSIFEDHARIMAQWRKRIQDSLESLITATPRKAKNRLAKLHALASTMREYAAFFGLDGIDAEVPQLPELPGEAAHALQRMTERQEQVKREAVARRVAALATDREAWLRGASVYYYGDRDDVDLRVVGDQVETSLGAVFPVSHAARGLFLVDAVMATGQEWKRNGHSCHLGHYQIDRITSDGTVYAGCHVVKYEAIKRIEDQLRSFTTTAA